MKSVGSALILLAGCLAIILCFMHGNEKNDSEVTESEDMLSASTATAAETGSMGSGENVQGMFERVLSGEEDFLDRDQAQRMTIKEYCENFGIISQVDVAITRYAAADLDADGMQELLLWITINETNDYGVLALRYDGNVTGYTFAYRQLSDLKKDGTFHYSGGAANHGTARLKFSDLGWEYVIIGAVEENDSAISFSWSGESVSEDEFWACFNAQSEKENVEWHPYPADIDIFG